MTVNYDCNRNCDHNCYRNCKPNVNLRSCSSKWTKVQLSQTFWPKRASWCSWTTPLRPNPNPNPPFLLGGPASLALCVLLWPLSPAELAASSWSINYNFLTRIIALTLTLILTVNPCHHQRQYLPDPHHKPHPNSFSNVFCHHRLLEIT